MKNPPDPEGPAGVDSTFVVRQSVSMFDNA